MTMDPSQPITPAPNAAPAANPAPPANPAPVVAVKPRAKSGGVLNILLVVAASVAIGGVAFAAGRSTAPASAFPGGGGGNGGGNGGNALRPGGSFDPANGGRGGLAAGGGPSIAGTVTAVDTDSLTLTLENGNEMTFTLGAGTTYSEATDATAADVAVGDDVSVRIAGGRAQTGAGSSGAPAPTADDVTVNR